MGAGNMGSKGGERREDGRRRREGGERSEEGEGNMHKIKKRQGLRTFYFQAMFRRPYKFTCCGVLSLCLRERKRQ